MGYQTALWVTKMQDNAGNVSEVLKKLFSKSFENSLFA